MNWQTIVALPAKRIKEAPGAQTTKESNYLQDYTNQYSCQEINPLCYEDAARNFKEALSDCVRDTSLFVFGAGLSAHPNHYYHQHHFSRIVASDIVPAAQTGLRPEIEFRLFNILTDEFEEKFDYIFSSHTVEHFTRDEIMNVILPKCLAAARRAVIFLTPWKDLGWGPADAKGPHIVELCEDNELAAKALRWKRVRDNPTTDHPDHYGLELILWFEGQA